MPQSETLSDISAFKSSTVAWAGVCFYMNIFKNRSCVVVRVRRAYDVHDVARILVQYLHRDVDLHHDGRYAEPENWVRALNKLPSKTIMCLVRNHAESGGTVNDLYDLGSEYLESMVPTVLNWLLDPAPVGVVCSAPVGERARIVCQNTLQVRDDGGQA